VAVSAASIPRDRVPVVTDLALVAVDPAIATESVAPVWLPRIRLPRVRGTRIGQQVSSIRGRGRGFSRVNLGKVDAANPGEGQYHHEE
jgi:hypothetical protein